MLGLARFVLGADLPQCWYLLALSMKLARSVLAAVADRTARRSLIPARPEGSGPSVSPHGHVLPSAVAHEGKPQRDPKGDSLMV